MQLTPLFNTNVDLDFALGRLQRELQSKNVKLMGALMFSCYSRGPGAKHLVCAYTRTLAVALTFCTRTLHSALKPILHIRSRITQR